MTKQICTITQKYKLWDNCFIFCVVPKSNLLFSGSSKTYSPLNGPISSIHLVSFRLDSLITDKQSNGSLDLSLILVKIQCAIAIPLDDTIHISTPTGSALCVMHHPAQDKLKVVHFVWFEWLWLEEGKESTLINRSVTLISSICKLLCTLLLAYFSKLTFLFTFTDVI